MISRKVFFSYLSYEQKKNYNDVEDLVSETEFNGQKPIFISQRCNLNINSEANWNWESNNIYNNWFDI